MRGIDTEKRRTRAAQPRLTRGKDPIAGRHDARHGDTGPLLPEETSRARIVRVDSISISPEDMGSAGCQAAEKAHGRIGQDICLLPDEISFSRVVGSEERPQLTGSQSCGSPRKDTTVCNREHRVVVRFELDSLAQFSGVNVVGANVPWSGGALREARDECLSFRRREA